MYKRQLNTLKLGNLGDNRESLLEQSKEIIISFFDKEQAINNFQEYSQYLRENHNVAIIKWDDIKQGTNKMCIRDRSCFQEELSKYFCL